MGNKISMDELKAMISTEIRQKNLNNEFGDNEIEKIQEKVRQQFGQNPVEINEVEEEQQIISEPMETVAPAVEPEISTQFQAELPEFLYKVEPAKLIIFDENELSQGGENMSNTQYRMMDDPDQKTTMRSLWLKDGKLKSEIFIARFEKIGEISYNHMDGTSSFSNLNKLEQKSESPYGNPYKEVSLPKDQFDIESMIDQRIQNALLKYVGTQEPKTNIPYFEGDIYEGLDMNKIVSGDEFEKINTPSELLEHLSGKNKNVITEEGKDFVVYKINGSSFIMPKNPLSTKKCYTKIKD